MMRLSSFIFLGSFLGTLIVSQISHACMKTYFGNFGKNPIKVVTSFCLKEEGSPGAYFFEAAERVFSGEFMDVQVSGNNLTAIWSDAYGSGPVELTFSEDASKFTGFYNESIPWSGSEIPADL